MRNTSGFAWQREWGGEGRRENSTKTDFCRHGRKGTEMRCLTGGKDVGRDWDFMA